MKDMKDKTRSPEHTSLQQPKHSIHRPCLTQLKEHEVENARDAVEGKTRKESRKVIVRSSYFQHKTVNINDQENKQDSLVKDNLATEICNDPVPKSAIGNRCSIGNALKRKKTTNDSVQEVSAYYSIGTIFFLMVSDYEAFIVPTASGKCKVQAHVYRH